MEQKNLLQYVLLIGSGFFMIFAVLVFSGIIPIGSKVSKFGGQVLLWGTVSDVEIRQFIADFNNNHKREFNLVYRAFPEEEFDQELLEAIAAARGPDLVLLPDNLIVRYEDKVFPVPFDSYPLRSFQDIFVEEGELFVTTNGILALPLFVDPLILYWNRDLFSSAGIALPPTYWDELLVMAPRLSLIEERTNIVTRSAVAMGEAVNITNFKAILSALFIQAGDNIIRRDTTGVLTPVLGAFSENGISAAESGLRFYTGFANPSQKIYSWNRALPEAERAFVGNQLAMYFGFASELADIRTKNPHLNFRTAMLPQIRGALAEKTFGRITGVAALRSSGNLETAFRVMFALSEPESVRVFATAARVAPARRDILVETEGMDADQSVFRDSAIIARGWLDPVTSETNAIFQTMVEGVTSGRERERGAVSRASRALQRLLPSIVPQPQITI